MMNKTSVEQLIAAAEESNFEPSKDLLHMVNDRASTTLPSLVVEEMFGAMKNSKFVRSTGRFRRPETSAATVLSKRVVDNRHRYTAIKAEVPLGTKGDRLPKEAFAEDSKKRSLPFGSMVSVTQSTTWHSPAPERNNVPVADLAMLRDVKPDWAAITGHVYMTLLSVKHRLAVRLDPKKYAHLPPGQGGSRWCFPLWRFPESSTIVWPVRLKDSPSGEHQLFELEKEQKTVEWLTLVKTRGVYAATFCWRSPLWQTMMLDKRVHELGKLSVRPFVDVPLRLSCECAPEQLGGELALRI